MISDLSNKSLESKLNYFFDEFFVFRGVLFSRGYVFHKDGLHVKTQVKLPNNKIIDVGEDQSLLPSKDVADRYGKSHKNCRFDICIPLSDRNVLSNICKNINFIFVVEKVKLTIEDPSKYKVALDEFVVGGSFFHNELQSKPKGSVLEIGSRARSNKVYRSIFPDTMEYVGFDVMHGPNVDVVGDAHQLSKHFTPGRFDFIFSNSTFEHLVMPWRVVLEMNQVLKLGGVVTINTHQTWPTHDEPWDFFRFSKHAWRGLFNLETGFEIIQSAQGLPAHVVPSLFLDDQVLDNQPGWMMSKVTARKIKNTELNWAVDPKDILSDFYPE